MTTRRHSMARQFFWLQAVVVLVIVVGGIALAVWDTRATQLDRATTRCRSIARTVAAAPSVDEHLAAGENTPQLEAYAEEVRRATDVDFVVVMTLDGTRWTHPTPELIGQKFVGDLGPAPAGGDFTQQYAGTLGPSVRAIVPVRDGGRVVGMVAVGITIDRIVSELPRRLAAIGLAAGVLIVVGAIGTKLLSDRLRRATHGMDEAELRRMYEYYDSVLHSVREGLVLLDPHGRVQLANAEAVRLLGLDAIASGADLDALGLPDSLVRALAVGAGGTDSLFVVGDRIVVVNQAPVDDGTGSVVTLRDHTELTTVTGELATVRGMAEALRSQNHEAANRLHTVVSLIELGRADDAVDFATDSLRGAQALADRVVEPGDEPFLAALLLGKTAQASQDGIDFVIDEDTHVTGSPIPASDAVTIVGNLIDNAFEAVAGRPVRSVVLVAYADATHFHVEVEDSGRGIPEPDRARVFARGWSTKGTEDGSGRGLGLALVAQAVAKHGGTVEVAESGLGGAAFVVDIDHGTPAMLGEDA